MQNNEEQALLDLVRKSKLIEYTSHSTKLDKNPTPNSQKSFKVNSLPYLEDIFNALEPEVWNPYPMISATPAQFKEIISNEPMFSDMQEDEVR